MILHDGDTVFLSLTSYSRWDGPRALVTECIVLDGANGILRTTENGRVAVLHQGVETVHSTEAEAWQRAAAEFANGSDILAAKAEECSRRAAALAVGRAVPA